LSLFTDMTGAAQVQYANLAQAARQHDLQRSIADLPGSFVQKTIKGMTYWYYQYKLPGNVPKQIYIGPQEDEQTMDIIRAHANPVVKQLQKNLSDLCDSALSLGCHGIIPKHAKVLERLALHGFFRAGGILVGTHAYLSYQNRFGIHWTGGGTTVDLDFAHAGKNLSIALNPDLKIDGHSAIETLKMGFIPANSGTRYVKEDEPDFDLDFLTCLHRGGDAPLDVPQLNLTLQPLSFMEFPMQDPVVSVMVSRNGPIVVNVPRPERYALTKLMLHPQRLEGRQPEKANKDLLQAASLIDHLNQNQPDALNSAWDDLIGRGPKWRRWAAQGLAALEKHFPEVDAQMSIQELQGLKGAKGIHP
jgi:hypothetical protein